MSRDSVWSRFLNRLLSSEIARRVNLAVAALDDFRDRRSNAGETDRDRRAYDREEVLEDALEAWRVNPLARRIVSLTTEYVVGGELAIHSEHAKTSAFLQDFWQHRLNRMTIRSFEWCDELSRSGELFIVLSTDPGGMSYVRAIPALDIDDILTAPNDVEQPLAFQQKPLEVGADPVIWAAYNDQVDGRVEDGSFPTAMLHYAINRPVGAKRGESDLAPLLKWLTRYGGWMEDRVRLNRFRQAFVYIVKKVFANESERLARQAELNANPPNPGSILVVHDDESWDVIHPKLDSFEASADGLALKKLIAVGAGVPMHFLAEPESSTRTTAEQAGGPTFRHYERRQIFFAWMMKDLSRIIIRRRAMVDSKVRAEAEITAQVTDIFAQDNPALAIAASTVVEAFKELRDRGLIDDEELLRMAYKFAGEMVDVQKLLKDGLAAGPVKQLAPAKPATNGSGGRDGIEVDADGEVSAPGMAG